MDTPRERRIRRILSRYGYKLRKGRNGSGYTITDGNYPDEPYTHYADIDELTDDVLWLQQRFETLEADWRET